MQVGNSHQILMMMTLMIVGIRLGNGRVSLTKYREQRLRFAVNVFGVHRVGSVEGDISGGRMLVPEISV